MSRVFDLAVMGGGPAGASAAITGAQLGFDVVLLEANCFPKHKVCGEFVSGEALRLLEQLLGPNDLLREAPHISSAHLFLDAKVLELPVIPAAIGLSRHDLDLELWLAAARTGVLTRERARVKDICMGSADFCLTFEGDELRAKAVVSAVGRWSNLTQSEGSGGGNWVGLKEHFFEESPSESCDLYFFDGGYCGVQPLRDGTVNVAAMVRADVAHNLPAVFTKSRELQARSRKWKPATRPVSTAPLLFRPPQTTLKGMALAGDAAAFIDPFVGDGISMALHSGRLAALSLAGFIRRETSLQSSLQEYARLHRQLIQPALRNAAHLRRLLLLPQGFRSSAIALLRVPALASMMVKGTRVRRAS